MIFWFFGFPGIGKDYCARRLSEMTDCFYVHADDYLTLAGKEKLQKGTFTTRDRLKKLKKICDDLLWLGKVHRAISIGDSLPNEQSRHFVSRVLGSHVRFVHVLADIGTHQRRIAKRSGHFFTKEMIDRWIIQHWEDPKEQSIIFDTTDICPMRLDRELHGLYDAFNKE